MREYPVRICEGLGVKFPGPTRQKRQINKEDGMSDSPPIASALPHYRFCPWGHNSQWYAVYCIVDA
jgi:hypothetical protein